MSAHRNPEYSLNVQKTKKRRAVRLLRLRLEAKVRLRLIELMR